MFAGYCLHMNHEEESALVIPVPQTEPVVKRWRETLDPGCILGLPAHITVLSPFAAPMEINDEMIATLEGYFSQFDPLDFTFETLGWFGHKVVYLDPTPSDVFRRITQGVVRSFPMHLPFEGLHGEPTPHLTIGQGAPLELLQKAAMSVAPFLPLAASADRVWLMAGGTEPGSWTLRHEFSFGSLETPTRL